jgi:tricorn protease-like protein
MKKLTTVLLGMLTLTAMAQTKQKLTPELLFKLGRVNNPQLSPNGKQVLYEVKHYELSTNKGTNIAYVINLPAGTPVAVTDAKANAFDPSGFH